MSAPGRNCRFCGSALQDLVVDLGASPLANSYLAEDDLLRGEVHYPLGVYVCSSCWLVQLPEYQSRESIFEDYVYFSSFSDSWLRHAAAYVEMMIGRFAIGSDAKVVEIASNDGYLLRNFVEAGVPVLGVEPAANVAEAAVAAGVPTTVRFFGAGTATDLVAEGHAADVMAANNVFAHVPDVNDFVEGFRILLKPEGVATLEFPDLARLVEHTEFDTIYHEHFSYFSLMTAERVFGAHGMRAFDVEELPTHGGSLRLFVCHEDSSHAPTDRLAETRERAAAQGLEEMATYRAFAERVVDVKHRLLEFLLQARRDGKSVVAYGAPAKGNTLLNYCGVGPDLIDYTVDRNPVKQGTYLPGSRIPVRAPEHIAETRPDYLLILPWNLRDEIIGQMAGIREHGGRFVTPIPTVEIHG